MDASLPSRIKAGTEPRKETMANRAASALRAEILSGALAPGAKVNLDRLRERLDLSLAPVREAVTRLACEGLVEAEDQRGYRVAPVSAEDLAEITMLRAEFDALALALSIERGDLDWESAVLAALHRLTRSTPADRATAHAAFHAALIAGAGAPRLIAQCARLYALTARYAALFGAPDDDPDTAPAIAAAAVARKADDARRLIADHARRTGAALAARLARAMDTD